MNIGNSMNEPVPRGAGLERTLLARLNEILADIPWISTLQTGSPLGASGESPDASIRLRSGSGTRAVLDVHVKREMRPSAFPAWSAARHDDASQQHVAAVLAMPIVSPRLAELCRRAHWGWVDLAGNCWLDIPGQLHVDRSGRPPVHRPPRRAANLSTSAAARVLRVLLSPAHAGRAWTQRDIQLSTCSSASRDRPVSLGLVNKVLRHLRSEGYIADAEERGIIVREPLGLLEAWGKAYRFEGHDRHSYFTLLKPDQLEEALYRARLDSGGLAAFAAFSAAERQAPQVRQPKTWIYVAAQFIDAMEKHAQAKNVDSGENLVVLVPEDSGVFLSFDEDGLVGDRSIACTDPVQTYVDLLQCGGRGEEAAHAILEQRILPAWEAVGLA